MWSILCAHRSCVKVVYSICTQHLLLLRSPSLLRVLAAKFLAFVAESLARTLLFTWEKEDIPGEMKELGRSVQSFRSGREEKWLVTLAYFFLNGARSGSLSGTMGKPAVCSQNSLSCRFCVGYAVPRTRSRVWKSIASDMNLHLSIAFASQPVSGQYHRSHYLSTDCRHGNEINPVCFLSHSCVLHVPDELWFSNAQWSVIWLRVCQDELFIASFKAIATKLGVCNHKLPLRQGKTFRRKTCPCTFRRNRQRWECWFFV